MCALDAVGVQGVRAADCGPFAKKGIVLFGSLKSVVCEQYRLFFMEANDVYFENQKPV